MAFPGKLYRDGATLKQQNVPGTLRLLFVEQFGFNHYLNNEIFKWIDALSDTGVNGMRVFGFWPFGQGQEEEPYVRTGGTFDLNQFNQRFFDYFDRWLTHAEACGIVVMYELFDSAGFWHAPAAQYHPYYQLVGADLKKFADPNNTRLMDVQKRYIINVAEIVRQHKNVIIGVMNEFKENKLWHYEMSRYVKALLPGVLVSGSEEDSPAAADPNADIWFVHSGRYDIATGNSNVPADAADLRKRAGNQKAIGFSTDGFGQSGMARENPTDMKRLAADVNRAGLQLFGFLDHYAYLANRGDSSAAQLNIDTYQALVNEFKPYPAPSRPAAAKLAPKYRFDEDAYTNLLKQGVPSGVVAKLRTLKGKEFTTKDELLLTLRRTIGRPQTDHYTDLFVKYTTIGRSSDGFLDVFRIANLPSTHPGATVEPNGKMIRTTQEQGFLCYGQYKKGYPVKPLKALFSIQIDNNTIDDRNILILDVYDHHSDRVIGKEIITRKDFAKANQFCLFTFDFKPPSAEANMEFRIYYMGHASVLADKIAVIDPADCQITEASQIPNALSTKILTDPSVEIGATSISGKLMVADSLKNGRTVGVVNGGQFTPDGYRITTNFQGYLVYETGITGNIGVEFTAKGYLDREECTDSKLVVLLMYDAPRDANWGDPAIWRDSHYSLLELRKRGAVPGFEHITNGFGLKCLSHGEGAESGSWAGHGLAGHPLEWNPNTSYHWVITWKDGTLDVRRNDQPLYLANTLPHFNPKGKIVVRIGGTHWGRGGPRNVTYSDVKIYRI